LAEAGARGLLLLAGLVLLAVGLAAAAGHQILARRARPEQAYRGPSPLIVFGLWFALVNLAALGLLALGVEGIDDPLTFLAGVGAQTIAYLLVVWLFVVRSGALSLPQMGLPSRATMGRIVRDIAFTVSVMLPVTLVALVGGGLIATLLDATPPSVVPLPETTVELVAVMAAAAILAPIGEELFFRGFALTAWLRDLGPRSALIRSSVFFAVIHIANIQTTSFDEGLRQAAVTLAVILPLGFVLGWLFLRRGLLGATVGHITYNGILVVLLVIAIQVS
jgi:membrane protease YdiL (CAAX protease family)